MKKLVIGLVRERSYDGVLHQGEVIVFPPEKRPFDVGDVIGDLKWRRTHTQSFTDEEILECVRDAVTRLGYFITGIEYSRNAGCGMCPCSPGFVIYTDRRPEKYESRTAIWLKQDDVM